MKTESGSIKYFKKMRVHCVRKRDDAVLTHLLTIAFTEEEAVLLSEHFKKRREEVGMTRSLFDAFLLFDAINNVDGDFLAEQIAKLKVKTELSKNLAYNDYILAMSLLKDHKEKKLEKQQAKQNDTPKKPKPQIAEPKIKPKRDRNFVPEIVIVKKKT